MTNLNENVNANVEEIVEVTVEGETVTCPHCYAEVTAPKAQKKTNTKGWWAFGFFLPIVAIIMYFMNKTSEDEKYPVMARGAFVCGVVSAVVLIIAAFTTAIFFGIAMLMLNTNLFGI